MGSRTSLTVRKPLAGNLKKFTEACGQWNVWALTSFIFYCNKVAKSSLTSLRPPDRWPGFVRVVKAWSGIFFSQREIKVTSVLAMIRRAAVSTQGYYNDSGMTSYWIMERPHASWPLLCPSCYANCTHQFGWEVNIEMRSPLFLHVGTQSCTRDAKSNKRNSCGFQRLNDLN